MVISPSRDLACIKMNSIFYDVLKLKKRVNSKSVLILISIAWEQALLFGQSKPAARAAKPRGASLAPCFFVSSCVSTFHDILQMESLLAG